MTIKKTFHLLFAAMLAFSPFAPPAAAGHCTLCEAAKEGDVAELRRLLDEGAEIDASHWGRGALFYAMVNHQLDAADLLLDRGANPNKRQAGTKGRSPFYVSAGVPVNSEKGMQILKKMLAKGGKVNDKNHDKSILIGPMYRSNLKSLRLLLEKGAEINGTVVKEAVNLRGNWWTDGNKLIIAEMLKYRDGGEFLKYYISNQDVNGLKEALKIRSPNYAYKGENGKTALMHAAHKPNEKLLEALLEKNPNVDAQDKAGKTALMYAAEANRVKTSKLLLEADANPDIADRRGKTVWDIISNKYLLRAIFRKTLLAKHNVDVGEDDEVN